MKFDDAKEKMSTIHKLHTARDFEGETIFYKKPYSAKKIIILTDDEASFDLNNVTHMSLSDMGVLIQHNEDMIDKLYPFPLHKIKDIIVES